MKRCLWFVLGVCFAAPLLAQATEGYVIADISLQAGPDTEYPSITELPAGMPVSIQGCLDDWSWCDVIAADDRGWVAGSFLEEDYDNQRVYVADYGPRIGIPVVTFSLGLYWDRHYHNRRWYGERVRWEGRHIHPRVLPRPAITATRAVRGHDEQAATPRAATQPNAAPQPGTPPPHNTAPQSAAVPTPPAPKSETVERHHASSQPAPKSETVERRHASSQAARAPQPPAHVEGAPAQTAPPETQHEAGQPHAPRNANAPLPPQAKAAPPKAEPKPHKKDEGERKGGDNKDHD